MSKARQIFKIIDGLLKLCVSFIHFYFLKSFLPSMFAKRKNPLETRKGKAGGRSRHDNDAKSLSQPVDRSLVKEDSLMSLVFC